MLLIVKPAGTSAALLPLIVAQPFEKDREPLLLATI
jgi:hypothetical protein